MLVPSFWQNMTTSTHATLQTNPNLKKKKILTQWAKLMKNALIAKLRSYFIAKNPKKYFQ